MPRQEDPNYDRFVPRGEDILPPKPPEKEPERPKRFNQGGMVKHGSDTCVSCNYKHR